MADTHKIKVIIPIINTQFNDQIIKEVNAALTDNFSADFENTRKGTASIESRYAEYLNTEEILRISKEAEQNKFDGIFIDCFGEPGVSIVRELVAIPVIGGFAPAALTASLISHKFSIISVIPNVVPIINTLVSEFGLTKNVASVRYVSMPVKELSDQEKLFVRLFRESKSAITDDGAEAIVLGCTGMLGVSKSVQEALADDDLPAQVINPTTASIGMLQSLIINGLTQSRLTFYPPPEPVAGG